SMNFELTHPISEKQASTKEFPSLFSSSSDKELLIYLLASIFLACVAILIHLGEEKYVKEKLNLSNKRKKRKSKK
ncbi:MAG: hypothetical protein KC516_01620, partial [Nanoarchaeota archaeon]|nr:hypothetical protein [Nanoarchaeota archaeon]